MNELEKITDSTLKTAEGIANFGVLVVIAACVIVLFMIMILYLFYNNRRMTQNMEKQLEARNKEMETALKTRNNAVDTTLEELKNYLMHISENARLSTLNTIYQIAENNFKLSVETVFNIVDRIQAENHVDDKEATKKKLKKFLTNINNERILYFKNLSYSGQTLDYYLSPKWIDVITDVAFPEIYSKNKGRTRTNIKQAYDSILIEFKQNLLTK